MERWEGVREESRQKIMMGSYKHHHHIHKALVKESEDARGGGTPSSR